MSRRSSFANTQRSSMAESRRLSGVAGAHGVSVRSSKHSEGIEYAERDMQVPMFSAAPQSCKSGGGVGGGDDESVSGRSLIGRRRSSVKSVDTTDSMSLIIDDPKLWREFQTKMKESKCVTGASANTKEVLRQFIKDKGLDEDEDDEDDEPSVRGGGSNRSVASYTSSVGGSVAGSSRRSFFQSFGRSAMGASNDSNHSIDSLDIDSEMEGRSSSSAAAARQSRSLGGAMMLAQASASRRGNFDDSFSSRRGRHQDQQNRHHRSHSAQGSRRSHSSWFGSSIISVGSQNNLDDQLGRVAADGSARSLRSRHGHGSSRSVNSFHNRRRSRSYSQDELSLPSSLIAAMKLEDARAEEREREEQEKRAEKTGESSYDHICVPYNDEEGEDIDGEGEYTITLGEPVKGSGPKRSIGLAHSLARGMGPAGGGGGGGMDSRRRSHQRSLSFHSCDSIDELSIESDIDDSDNDNDVDSDVIGSVLSVEKDAGM